MNYRVSSPLSKAAVLNNAKDLFAYKHWYSLPKDIDGSVEGARIHMVRRGGFFTTIGRGRFDGVVQEIDGKAYIVGRLSSPVFAVGLGVATGLIWAFAMIYQNHWATGLIGATAWILGAYTLIKHDHSKLKAHIKEIASASNQPRQRAS